MATTAELLASVESAISYRLGRIAAGEFLEQRFGDKAFKEYSIEELFRIRSRLLSESATASGGLGFQLRRLKSPGMD